MIEAVMSISFLSQRTGNWSKWGGGRMNFVSLFSYTEWFCQSCGDRQTRNLPSYMIPIDILNRDFAKVCSECKWKFIKKKFTTFSSLKTLGEEE